MQALVEEIAAAETIIALALIVPTAIAARSALSDMIDGEQAYLECADQHPDAIGHDEVERIREMVQWAVRKDQELVQWIAEHGNPLPIPLPF